MPFDPYAVTLAQRERDRQIAHATEHRLARWHRVDVGRRPLLRPVGRLLVRVGHALDGDVDPSVLQPARSR